MKNEIRFTLESKQRPKLAQEIGNLLGTAPHYERVPSCAYDIAGYRLDKEGVLHIPEGAEETAKDLILQLRERGFQDDAEVTEEVPVQQEKLTIAIQKESLTDTALENLQKIIANKQTLFQRTFRTGSTEVCRVTIDVTPCLYTKTVKYFRILIAKPKSHRKGVLNRHEYNNILTTIFAT